MSDYYGMADALEMVESELGQTFTFNGVEYDCVYGERTENKTLEYGGYALDADLVIVVREELFKNDDYPEPQETLTVGTRSLRVDTVTHSPDNAFLVIGCKDPNKA